MYDNLMTNFDKTYAAVLQGQGLVRNLDIDFNNLHLVEPCMEYMDSFREALLEYMAHRVEEFAYPKLSNSRDAKAYLRRIKNFRKGKVPQGFVPSSAFWLVDGRHYLGSGDVRHCLNDALKRLGGHVGYSIRPSAWHKGLGNIQLALLLEQARLLNIERAVITCYDSNSASAKVIEKNGGILVNKVVNRVQGVKKLTRIYEVEL